METKAWLKEKINNFFWTKVEIYPLITFRILFGILTLVSTLRFLILGWVEDQYVKPVFHFKYFGFEWVEVLPYPWIYIPFILMIISSIGIILGAWYRLSAIVFFLSFTYVELLDLTYYLNHYYFVSLVALIMIFLPANRLWSIDVIINPKIKTYYINSIFINILKFQIGIVYFYAGIAKINYDWLIEAMPLKLWLPANDNMPIIGWLFNYTFTAYVFSWAGMLFDLSVVFFLLNKGTRLLAYFTLVLFHIITGWMFQIGVFPLVMSTCTLIFFSNRFHQNILNFLPAFKKYALKEESFLNFRQNSLKKYAIYTVVGAYILFQVLFPFRYLLYRGNLFWTEEGYRFSWRVMLIEKAGTATFYVIDSKNGIEGVVYNGDFLNQHQEKQMSFQPDMILQFAHYLKKYYSEIGVTDPKVRCEAYVTLNGRQSRLLIDPNLDLTTVKDSFKPKYWILD
jgi:hypothetical protein